MEAVLLILVVEDDVAIQELLEDALTEAGFKIRKSFSSEEAIKALDEPENQIRALITDIELKSKLTGWDVARHARHITPELPVIYATSSGSDWQEMGVPNSILITKPFAPAQVVTAVSQLLNAAPAPIHEKRD